MKVEVNELKPCPFCGNSSIANNEHLIGCCKCEAYIPHYLNKDATVKKWNTRHSDTE